MLGRSGGLVQGCRSSLKVEVNLKSFQQSCQGVPNPKKTLQEPRKPKENPGKNGLLNRAQTGGSLGLEPSEVKKAMRRLAKESEVKKESNDSRTKALKEEISSFAFLLRAP